MLQSYKAMFENGIIKFVNQIPNVRKSNVIVTFLDDVPNNRIEERIEALRKLIGLFKNLPDSKRDEFDGAIARKPLLKNRQVEL